MSLQNLIEEIGDDADLLTRSDEWLEEERKSTAASLDRIARELHAIQMAQRIKRVLQQYNLVAVQSLVRSNNGDINNIAINVMNLPDAIKLLSSQNNDTIDAVNLASQLYGWNSDGYDVATSAQLR